VALARAEESLASICERESEIKEGLEARREAEEALSEERSELEKLGIEIETLTADQAAHRTRLEQMEARIAALETGTAEEATCPVCGQTLTQEHREALLGRYHQELAESHEVLESLKDERRELEQKRQVRLEKVETLEFDLQTLPRPKDIEDVAERVAAHQEEVASRQVSVEETRERVSHLDSQLGDVKHAVADLREKLESTTEQRASLQDAVRSQEVRLDALPRPAELDQLRDRMNVQTSVVEEHQETVANLSDAPDEVKNLSTALEALGNPRRDYQRAGDVAERRPEVIQARADVESEQIAHQAKATSLKEKLDAYGDLDARIETERSILNEHEAAHRRYVAHLREAEALDGYQETHRQVTSELSEARETLETVRTAQEKARTAYDPEAHAEARDTRGNLRERLAALNERLAQRRLQLSETEAEIDRLQTLAAELETAASERDTLESLQRLLEYLRGVLREAGPVITRRLVDVISLRADRLYREIMQDYAARLRWTEDYDIILKQGGRERSFQQLSGGEQMAAALAVRLALLQEVSTVDVAFFDEPTANLDERRRANLAEQILGIQGFNQLFVISHDDTFEQDTDHVIRVRKDDGVSQVEV
jgi:exonuclease SbcC